MTTALLQFAPEHTDAKINTHSWSRLPWTPIANTTVVSPLETSLAPRTHHLLSGYSSLIFADTNSLTPPHLLQGGAQGPLFLGPTPVASTWFHSLLCLQPWDL